MAEQIDKGVRFPLSPRLKRRLASLQVFRKTLAPCTPPIQNFQAVRVDEKNKAKVLTTQDFSIQKIYDALNSVDIKTKKICSVQNEAALDPIQCGFAQFRRY